MGTIHAIFIGGPLDGKGLDVEDRNTYTATDRQSGNREFRYHRRSLRCPDGPDSRFIAYVAAGVPESEVAEAAIRAFASRDADSPGTNK